MNNSTMVRLSPDEIIQNGDILHFSTGKKTTGAKVVEMIGGRMTVGEFKKYTHDEQPVEVYRSNVMYVGEFNNG